MSHLLVKKHLVKFVIAGGFSACIEYGAFSILAYVFRLPVVIAQPISFLCGLTTSFLCNKLWVFCSDDKRIKKREVGLFFILGCINLLLTTVLIELLVAGLGIDKLIAKLIVMACVATWNYLLFQQLIFRQAM